jgi:uncharacterized membrane protein YfhO
VDRADYNLIGVQLPSGARNIDLRFEDPAYDKGKNITVAALLAALIAIVVGAVRGTGRPRRFDAQGSLP